MLRRLLFPYLLIFALTLALAGGCDTEPPPFKPYRIAIVHTDDRFAPFIESFKERLNYLNYLEGESVIYLYDGPTPPEKVVDRLISLKGQNIDLLYTITSPVTRKAYEIFKDSGTPIVFGPVFSPLEAGLTTSLLKPDKNMTGVMIRGGIPKAFGLLQETMPNLKTITVPFPVNEQTSQLSLKDLQESAATTGIKIVPAAINTMADLTDYLQHIPPEAEALWLLHSPFLLSNNAQIVAAATARKIPVVAATARFENDLLLSYSPNLDEIGKQVARLADKLLQGVPASELPIEHCEYQLMVDLEVAKQTGVTVPDNILQQAAVTRSAIAPPPDPAHQ
ncbi:MAG: ABC transporter substrate-binding protein [Desulfobulbaceae bacterium]|nr:ABC transporter substrate-binding protein [Desulfobulbaceae bacterium]